MKKYGPKQAGHPSIGNPCPVCGEKFKEGDYTTLIVMGEDEAVTFQLSTEGDRDLNARAAEIHWGCSGFDDLIESLRESLMNK